MAWTTPKTWTVGEVLTAANLNAQVRDNSRQVAGVTKPSVKVTHNVSQNLSTGALRSLDFNTEAWDYGGMHVTGSSSHRLKVQTGGDGVYLIGASVNWFSTGTDKPRITSIEYNSSDGGGTFLTRAAAWPPTVAQIVRQSVSVLHNLVATDYVCVTCFNGTTSTAAIYAHASTTPVSFWATWDSA